MEEANIIRPLSLGGGGGTQTENISKFNATFNRSQIGTRSLKKGSQNI